MLVALTGLLGMYNLCVLCLMLIMANMCRLKSMAVRHTCSNMAVESSMKGALEGANQETSMAEAMRMLTQAMANVNQGTNPDNQPSLDKFMQQNSKGFVGALDLVEAEEWIASLEKTMRLLSVQITKRRNGLYITWKAK